MYSTKKVSQTYPTKKSSKISSKFAPGCSPGTATFNRRQAWNYIRTRDVLAVELSSSVVHVCRPRRLVELVDKSELRFAVK